MEHRLLHEVEGLRTFVVVFDKGDDPKSGLEEFARRESITGASLSAIGAFQAATLAYFDRERLEYLDVPVDEQVEVLSFLGDIALNGGEPEVHAHLVVGYRDGHTAGGHLRTASVWPTLEVVVHETPSALCKQVDPSTGLALISPNRAG